MAEKKKQTTKKKSTGKKIILVFWMMFFGGLLAGTAYFYALGNNWLWKLPAFEELENPKSNLASEIYTSDGKLLGKFYSENRSPVKYQNLPPHLVEALVSTEDERYYSHSGLDISRLITATLAMGTRGGASTISQQLSKLLFSEPAQSTIERLVQKTQEWVIAAQLERQYTKDEIITMYFNKFDFINHAVGIESASQIYFNTTTDSLKLHEAAMLVGMLKNPALYNPLKREELVKNRRNTVFYQMKRNEKLTQAEFDSLKVLPLGLDFKKIDHKEGRATYFREYLRSYLKKMFNKKDEDGNYVYRKPDDSKYNIYRDGLKIYTTIDSKMQEYAEWSVKEHLSKELQAAMNRDLKRKKNPPFNNKISKKRVKRLVEIAKKRTSRYRIAMGKECPNCHRRSTIKKESIDGKEQYLCTKEDCKFHYDIISKDSLDKSFETPVPMKIFTWKGEVDTTLSPLDSILYYKSFLHVGLMSVDPRTAHIKAWVGGVNQKYFAYDHVGQGKRQVGSTFKPFVYALAMENGLTPCKKVPNIPVTFKKGEYGLLKDWTPRNADKHYVGDMVTLKFGLAESNNWISSWVMKQYGPSAVIKYCRRMGLTSKLDTVPALVLGVSDVSLFEMVGAYSTFANKGISQTPIFITSIEDKNGAVVKDFEPEAREAMSERFAYAMLELLKGTTMGARAPDGKRRGTAIRLHLNRPYGNIPWDRPIAGKTGTTQGNADGWFMGVTPDLATGVWVGTEEPSVSFSTTYMGQGANTALPIWGYYMKKVWGDSLLGISKEDFEKPQGKLVEFDCNVIDQNKFNFDDGSDDEGDFDK